MWQNIKVVELASVLAGPLVGTFFAELGAEVTKIENKTTGGDVTRSWKLPTEDKNKTISAYYAAANFDKKSIFLDYANPSDISTCFELLANADIVIQNFKAGDAEKFGLDAQSLLKQNPKLIIACIHGFAPNDPRPAFDVVLQAESGFMYMNGKAGDAPVKMPVALIDVLAAHHVKEAILVAFIEKMQTGKGKIVNVSLYDAALASLANQASNYLMANHIPQPMGTLHPNIAPYGEMFLCKDQKYIVLAVGNDTQFEKLWQVLNLTTEDLKDFKTNALRLQYRNQLNNLLKEKIEQESSETLIHSFNKAKIPAAIVKNLQHVFENPSAQKLVQEFEMEGVKCKRVKTLLT